MLPAVIGHRGAAASAPENTLAGFRRAAQLGAPWVELDVHLTADGRLAVIHDATLGRTTNGRGRVAARTARQLAGLDAGGWFAARFRGEPVPMLDDALAVIAQAGMGVNVEIKPTRARARETLIALEQAVKTAWNDAGPLLISSFDRHALTLAAERLGGWPRALLAERLPRDWRAIARRLDCVSLHLDQRSITSDLPSRIRDTGLELAAYTVNDPARARRLWQWGVDALFSDAPDLLLAERRKAQ